MGAARLDRFAPMPQNFAQTVPVSLYPGLISPHPFECAVNVHQTGENTGKNRRKGPSLDLQIFKQWQALEKKGE
jgi:hypothetical protein